MASSDETSADAECQLSSTGSETISALSAISADKSAEPPPSAAVSASADFSANFGPSRRETDKFAPLAEAG